MSTTTHDVHPVLGTTTTTTYDDVSVTVRVVGSVDRARAGHGTPWAWVVVRCLPGRSYWSCPSADRLRDLVDRALDGSGMRRDGARDPATDGPLGEWRFRYHLRAVDGAPFPPRTVGRPGAR